jgi:hypothetical protein
MSALAREDRFGAILVEARRQGTIPADAPESLIRRLARVGKANVEVIQGYEPRTLRVPVQLFVPRTKGGLAEVSGQVLPEAEDLGWSSDTGQPVQIHELPGDHFTMMVGDGAAQLARELAALMRSTSRIELREAETAEK